MRTGIALSIVSALALASAADAQVVINEVMARNASVVEDPDEPGAFEDWIELYNAGESAALIGGMHLSDDDADRTRWTVPAATVLRAGEHIVFWADGEPEQGARHMSFKLDGDGEAVSLWAPGGTRRIDRVTFGSLPDDVSFGRYPDGGERLITMPEPTPGAANTIGHAAPPSFSVPSRTFTEAFELEFASPEIDARIYYTLDGSEPSEEDGALYSAPISIDRTLRVRARVYPVELLPSPVDSRSYIRVDASAAAFESNLPIVVIDTHGVDVDRLTRRPRRFQPVITGIIETSTETGRATITGEAEYAGNAAMHVRGESVVQYPKKQYAFEIRGEDDADLGVSLLGLPRESDWVLQAPYSDKTLMRNHLMYGWSRRAGRWAPRTRFCEVFLHREARGAVTADDYRGVYVFMEKIKRDDDRVDIARLGPEDSAEPEITGGYILKKDWLNEPFFTTSTYNDSLVYVDPESRDLTIEQRTWLADHFDEFERALAGPDFDDTELGYARYVDVDSFIDHHLMVEMARDVDGFVLSTYFHKDRDGKITMGPLWDFNGALGAANYFCSFEPEGWHHEFDEADCGDGGETFPADNPSAYRWYERLFEDPDFRGRYAERWAELRADALRDEVIFQDIVDAIELLTDGGAPESPVSRNFEKWNVLDRWVWPNFLASGTYEEHVGWMVDFLERRLAWMDAELTAPPRFSHPGGRVEPGLEVQVLAPAGEIWMTINGPDPRGEDGDPVARAVRPDGPVLVSSNTRLRARVRTDSGTWSDLAEAIWVTSVPSVVVTEIMYKPAAPPAGNPHPARRFEFIEIFNAGDEPVDLVGLRFTGRLRFDFAMGDLPTLDPGRALVVVGSREAFATRYDDGAITIAGEYEGVLANAGQEVVLVDGLDDDVARFSYANWYAEADGGGHSLELIGARSAPANPSDAASWRPSTAVHGSPGVVEAPEGGAQRPGDLDQDGRLGLSDAVALFDHLFRGGDALPCVGDDANAALADVNGDGRIDLSDGISTLEYLFLGGRAPALGTDCARIAGCPDVCASPERDDA